MRLRVSLFLITLFVAGPVAFADPQVNRSPESQAQVVFPPYSEQHILFDFYFDHPQKVGPALSWIDSAMRSLTSEPYNYLPEFLDFKVLFHGSEVVTLAKANYKKYEKEVERMRFLASLGVEFRVCATSLKEFGYRPTDVQEFLKIVPSAVTDLAHWQLMGYAVIQPTVLIKKYATEDIR